TAPAGLVLSKLTLPEALPVSLPSALVAQRPDVAAQAALVHRASAEVGVATAAMLPQFPLTAAIGGRALHLTDLLGSGAGFWSIVGAATQPIFNGGALDARRRAAHARLEQASAQY